MESSRVIALCTNVRSMSVIVEMLQCLRLYATLFFFYSVHFYASVIVCIRQKPRNLICVCIQALQRYYSQQDELFLSSICRSVNQVTQIHGIPIIYVDIQLVPLLGYQIRIGAIFNIYRAYIDFGTMYNYRIKIQHHVLFDGQK